jgi:hypothetical protein
MSESPSWFESLFRKNDPPENVTRNRSNSVSNTSLPTRDNWSKFRQVFNLSNLISAINTEEPLSSLRYVNRNLMMYI